MTGMPVFSQVNPHVIANEQNSTPAELRCQIETLETGISARSNMPQGLHDDLVALNVSDHDPFDLFVLIARFRILREFDAFELLHPVMRRPPSAVTAVKHVGPWGELPGLIDGDDLSSALQAIDAGFLRGRPTAYDCNGFALPIWPPSQSVNLFLNHSCLRVPAGHVLHRHSSSTYSTVSLLQNGQMGNSTHFPVMLSVASCGASRAVFAILAILAILTSLVCELPIRAQFWLAFGISQSNPARTGIGDDIAFEILFLLPDAAIDHCDIAMPEFFDQLSVAYITAN